MRKAVGTALERVAQIDPPLARLLEDCVQTGAVCRYDPDPFRPIRCVTDPVPHIGQARQGQRTTSGRTPG